MAVTDPEGFANAVSSGQIKTEGNGKLVVGPRPDTLAEGFETTESEDGTDADGNEEKKPTLARSTFVDIPAAQNVVRCPPINWAKYHIVGESLDKLHDEQRKRPTPGQPHTDEESSRAPVHVVAAPYNPWIDKLPESSMQTRSLAKKEG